MFENRSNARQLSIRRLTVSRLRYSLARPNGRTAINRATDDQTNRQHCVIEVLVPQSKTTDDQLANQKPPTINWPTKSHRRTTRESKAIDEQLANQKPPTNNLRINSRTNQSQASASRIDRRPASVSETNRRQAIAGHGIKRDIASNARQTCGSCGSALM